MTAPKGFIDRLEELEAKERDYDALASHLSAAEARLADAESDRDLYRKAFVTLDAMKARVDVKLSSAERDAARYRWIHDNIDWVDGVGYTLGVMHPDGDGCAIFQWCVDNAMRASECAKEQP